MSNSPSRHDIGIIYLTYVLHDREHDLLAVVNDAVEEHGWVTLAEDMSTIAVALMEQFAAVMDLDSEDVFQELARFFGTPEDERHGYLFSRFYGIDNDGV